MSRPERQSQQQSIRALFTRIAPHYDVVNRLISVGQDQRLRSRALRLTGLPSDGLLLDVGTGTGDVALRAQAMFSGSHIVGLDPTTAMLARARQKSESSALHWTRGDGLALPYPNDAFDAVISAFLMRNVPDVAGALAEQARVVRPGGRVVCLEMSWPRRFPMSQLFYIYFFGWVPLMGQLFTGDREAYTYLPQSVKAFARPQTLAQHMRNAGLIEVVWERHVLGTTAILVGQKPETS